IEQLKEFRKTNYWKLRDYTIFYQRPLKSSKRFVSNCQFERGNFDFRQKSGKVMTHWNKKTKKAIPVSSPLYQEFRIWQKLNQINYSSTVHDVFQLPLKKEWLQPIANAMMNNYSIYLNRTPKVEKDGGLWISKILFEEGMITQVEAYTFFIDKEDSDIAHEEKNANKITGNVTYASFIEALGKEKFDELLNDYIVKNEQRGKDEVVEVRESKLFQLWQTLYM